MPSLHCPFLLCWLKSSCCARKEGNLILKGIDWNWLIEIDCAGLPGLVWIHNLFSPCSLPGLRAAVRFILAWNNRPVAWANKWRLAVAAAAAAAARRLQPAARVPLPKRRPRQHRPWMTSKEVLNLISVGLLELKGLWWLGLFLTAWFYLLSPNKMWIIARHVYNCDFLCLCEQSWWQRRGSWTSWAAAIAPRTPTAPHRPAATTAPTAATRRMSRPRCPLQPRPTTACPSSPPPAAAAAFTTRRVEEHSWTHSVSCLLNLTQPFHTLLYNVQPMQEVGNHDMFTFSFKAWKTLTKMNSEARKSKQYWNTNGFWHQSSLWMICWNAIHNSTIRWW